MCCALGFGVFDAIFKEVSRSVVSISTFIFACNRRNVIPVKFNRKISQLNSLNVVVQVILTCYKQ